MIYIHVPRMGGGTVRSRLVSLSSAERRQSRRWLPLAVRQGRITTNCDSHPLLNRLHKPDPELPPDAQDKRSLIHVDPSDWETWLRGRHEDVLPLIKPPAVEDFDMSDAIRTDEALAALGR